MKYIIIDITLLCFDLLQYECVPRGHKNISRPNQKRLKNSILKKHINVFVVLRNYLDYLENIITERRYGGRNKNENMANKRNKKKYNCSKDDAVIEVF